MPTSLVRRFHGLPRFDTKLASVPATFDITWKYGEVSKTSQMNLGSFLRTAVCNFVSFGRFQSSSP